MTQVLVWPEGDGGFWTYFEHLPPVGATFTIQREIPGTDEHDKMTYRVIGQHYDLHQHYHEGTKTHERPREHMATLYVERV